MRNGSEPPKVTLHSRRSVFPRVRAIGQKRTIVGDLYHFVMGRGWLTLTAIVFTGFVLGNLIFCSLYLAVPGSIGNAHTGSFWDAFFFSVETMATIGYGEMFPANSFAHAVVTIEAFAGVVGFALVAGITFAKFSKPTAKVLFSKNAVISRRNGIEYLMFRMANWRRNEIVQAQLTVVLLVSETTTEGEQLRRFVDLPLVRGSTPFFTLTWTALHRIDESSLFYGPDALQRLAAAQGEIILSLQGLDDRIVQTIHASHTYKIEDVVTDARFADVLTVLPTGERVIDYRQFHALIPQMKQAATGHDIKG